MSEEVMGFETPFGVVKVFHNSFGKQIPFFHSIEEHTFENGVTADVHLLVIDPINYEVGDIFQIRIGVLDNLEFHSSDENVIMYEYHDDKYCIGLIGTETDYSERLGEFLTGRTFSFTEYPSKFGIDYKLIRDPQDESIDYPHICTRIVWLPISDEYSAVDLIDFELV